MSFYSHNAKSIARHLADWCNKCAVYDSDTPAGADGDCVSVARARRMTIRAFSIQLLAAIHPPCGGCRIIVGCVRAANGLSEQRAQGGGTGDVVQKRFVRGSATAAAYLASKAPNIALVSHRQRCAGVLDCTSSLSERTYQPLTETLRRPAYQYLCASDGCRIVASTCLRNGFVTAQSQRGVVLSGCYLLSAWQRHI